MNVFISQFLQAAVIIFIYDQLIQKYDSDSIDKEKNLQENHLEKAIIFNFHIYPGKVLSRYIKRYYA